MYIYIYMDTVDTHVFPLQILVEIEILVMWVSEQDTSLNQQIIESLTEHS